MDLVTLKIICLFTRIVIFRIDLALQYIFDKFLSLSLRWLQKILVPGLMVVGMESYKCLAPPMEPLDQVDKIVQMWPKVKITNQFVQIPPLGLICQCQVDGHTLSSVSLASVGCPDPALLSNIFQVQTGANVDGKDLHPLTCTLGSALSFVTGHPVGAPPRCHWYHHFIFGELHLTNHCHSWDSQKNISRSTAAVSTVSPPSTTTLNCPQSPSLCQTSHTTYRLFVEINLFDVATEIYLVWMQLCRDLRKLWLWRSPIPRPLSHLQITGWPFSQELGHLILPHSSSKVQPQRGSILISSKSWKRSRPKLNHSEIFSSVEAYGRTQTLFAREARSTQYRNSLEEYSKWEILEAYKIWEGVDLPPPAARCLLTPPLLLPQRHRHLAGRSQLRRPPRLQCWGGDI